MKKTESITLLLEKGDAAIKTGHIQKSEPFELIMNFAKDGSGFRMWTSYEQLKEMSEMLVEITNEVDKFFKS